MFDSTIPKFIATNANLQRPALRPQMHAKLQNCAQHHFNGNKLRNGIVQIEHSNEINV